MTESLRERLARAFLVESFRDHLALEAGSSRHTVEGYSRDISRLAEFAASKGVHSPSGLTPALLRQFVYLLKDLGLSAATIRRAISSTLELARTMPKRLQQALGFRSFHQRDPAGGSLWQHNYEELAAFLRL